MSDRLDLLIVAGGVLTPAVVAGEVPAAPGFVGVRDGIVVAVGEGAAVADWSSSAARIVDVGDGTLAAGFVDAHVHPIIGLKMARGVDLSGIRDRAAVRAALAAHVVETDDEWVLGWGLDPAVFDGAEFGNALLDGIADGRKVYLTMFDGHSALVSDAALTAAGIRGDEAFADASTIGVHPDGRPNGMLYELAAQALVQSLLPEPGFDETVAALGALFAGMAESGLVGAQMLDLGDPTTFDLLEALEEQGDLAIRLRVSPWVMPGHGESELEALAALQGRRGRRWEVRGIKLMIDGTIDNGTAWLAEPDTHGESTESLWLDPGEYQRALEYFHVRGIPTTTHAIGDAGISFVARSIAALHRNGTQHRIEHIETLPDAVLDEIVEARAAASMQPTHCTLYTKADHSDNWSRRLGAERADLGWRIGDLRDRGVPVALGSDWPIAPFDPRPIFAAAQLRRNAGCRTEAPIAPGQGLSARRALEGFTSEYWRSVGESGGTIEIGGRADFTAFAMNPLTADADEFATARVLLTVVDGEVVVDTAPVH